MRSDAVRTALAHLLAGALLGTGTLVAADLATVLSTPPLGRPSAPAGRLAPSSSISGKGQRRTPVSPVGAQEAFAFVPDATRTLAATTARVAPIASGPWISPLYPQNGVPLWHRIWLSPETNPWDFLLGTAILLHASATAALMRSESPDAEIPARYRDLQDVAAAAQHAGTGSQHEETRTDRWSNAPATIGRTSPPEVTPVSPADEVSPTGDGDRRRDLAVMTAMIGRRHAATALTLQPYQLSLGPEVSPASAATPAVRH